MALHEDIKASLRDALKSKQEVKLRTVRSILTAFTNELVANGKTPRDMLDDEQALVVIKRLAKQRRESIVQYEKAGRDDLAQTENEELEVLESYLPQMMSPDEIRSLAEAKKEKLDIDDKSKMGMLVGALMKDLKGKADGADVKTVVEELF